MGTVKNVKGQKGKPRSVANKKGVKINKAHCMQRGKGKGPATSLKNHKKAKGKGKGAKGASQQQGQRGNCNCKGGRQVNVAGKLCVWCGMLCGVWQMCVGCKGKGNRQGEGVMCCRGRQGKAKSGTRHCKKSKGKR